MKKIFICILLVLVTCSLVVPAFAAQSSSVRYGLYEDYFIFEGVSYAFEKPSADVIPSFMYLVGDELSVVFRSPSSSPYVIIAGDGKLTYYDANVATRMIYSVSNSIPTYQWTSSAKRLDAPSVDVDAFRSGFIVSLHDIYFAPDFNAGALFRSAEPFVMYDDVVDDPEYKGDITEFFASLFGGLALVFETAPMLYLLGILILAFVIFIIKMIYRR